MFTGELCLEVRQAARHFWDASAACFENSPRHVFNLSTSCVQRGLFRLACGSYSNPNLGYLVARFHPGPDTFQKQRKPLVKKWSSPVKKCNYIMYGMLMSDGCAKSKQLAGKDLERTCNNVSLRKLVNSFCKRHAGNVAIASYLTPVVGPDRLSVYWLNRVLSDAEWLDRDVLIFSWLDLGLIVMLDYMYWYTTFLPFPSFLAMWQYVVFSSFACNLSIPAPIETWTLVAALSLSSVASRHETDVSLTETKLIR